jgi:sigma-B regulation protein RsbU (phosphoserine phosphatase)
LSAQLELIARMSQDFASSLDIDATLGAALGRITQHIGAEGGAVFLLEDGGETLVCRACAGPVKLTGLRLASREGVVGRCVQANAGQIVRDALNDPNFQPRVDAGTGFVTRSILCAPLAVQDQRLGAIELVNKTAGDGLFERRDMQLLQTMASSAALALSNARFAADLAEREGERRELELAAEIQRSLLPEQPPPPFPVGGVTVPARIVSGDFFDFLPLADGRISFSVGDVSGKGVRAALLMAKAASLYRCLAKADPTPDRLLRTINDEICATATRGMFVTMLVGVYDAAHGAVRIANAGHEPPLLHGADGAFHVFPARMPPVGITPSEPDGEPFPEDSIVIQGGALYVFTDGVTEARGDDGRPLGIDGLQRIIAETARLGLRERIDAIARRIGRQQPHDDVTLLAIDGGGGGGR